jgi:nucleoside-diphosphate-sugar epimerase
LVTGAAGYIGGAVAARLARGGHDVLGAVRDSTKAAGLAGRGIHAVQLDVREDRRLAAVVDEVDSVVHCAFAATEPSGIRRAIALERQVTDTLTAGRATVVYTSGIGVLADPGASDPVEEDHVPAEDAPMAWRYALERQVVGVGGRVVRPALVHGRGGNRILHDLISQSRTRGAAGFVPPGTNRLPTVHVDDLADAYARVVDDGAPRSTYTVVGSSTTPRAVAEAIAELLGVPVRPLEETVSELPALGWIAGDLAVSATRANSELGWRPTGPSLPEDLAHGSYRGRSEAGPESRTRPSAG